MKTKEELPACPVATAVSLIGGKWKLLILRNLKTRPWRFNELQRDLEGISQKVLTDSLRQMIDDGLAYRHDYHETPPHVEYGLTSSAERCFPSLMPLPISGTTTNPSSNDFPQQKRRDLAVTPLLLFVIQPPRYALRTRSLVSSSAPVPSMTTRPVSRT